MFAVEHATQPVRLRANVARRNIEKTYTARLAITSKTRNDAYHVRHRSYVNAGLIDPQPGGLFSDNYDPLPNSHTIVIYQDARPVASVRVSFLSHNTLDSAPAGVAFPEEVSGLLADCPTRPGRAQAAEINRLVRSPECENDQGLVFLLFRAAGYLVIQEDVSLLMLCIRQNHAPFYRRLGCTVASAPKLYPGLHTAGELLAYPRANYDEACAAFPIMNPLAGAPGSFAGFMSGREVAMPLFQKEASARTFAGEGKWA